MTENLETDKKKNENVNFIETLREKSEETDMNIYLKSAFGGYTKQSVLDYFGVLKKNQQTMSETFQKNQQALYEEKEKLKKTNETLTNRLNKIEAEHQAFTENIRTSNNGSKEFNVNELLELKALVAKLETEAKKEKDESANLKRTLEQKQNTSNELVSEINQLKEETTAIKEMLKSEQLEIKKLRSTVADQANTIEGERDEIKYWKGLQTEGKQAELSTKVHDLSEQLSMQTALLEKENLDREIREEAFKSLTEEVEALKANIGSMTHILENTNLQNDKLMSTNNALTSKLEEDYKISINLIREKSEMNIDKLIAIKKMGEAESRISILELQINKNCKSDEIKTLK